MRWGRFLWLLGLALWAARAVPATTLIRMSLEEMTSAAQAVARVRCVSNQTRWEGGEIWTFTSFEVAEVWKGLLPPRITVRLLGGRAGHLISIISGVPRFQPGEKSVLFLELTRGPYFSVIGWAQGTFRIRCPWPHGPETVMQDTASISIFEPRAREFQHEGIRDVELGTFRERVLSALARERRSDP